MYDFQEQCQVTGGKQCIVKQGLSKCYQPKPKAEADNTYTVTLNFANIA